MRPASPYSPLPSQNAPDRRERPSRDLRDSRTTSSQDRASRRRSDAAAPTAARRGQHASDRRVRGTSVSRRPRVSAKEAEHKRFDKVAAVQGIAEKGTEALGQARDFFGASVARTRALLVAGIIAAIVLAVVGPVRDYYVAVRTNQDLSAYYAELKDEESVLKKDIAVLMTEDGVETEARARGYVMVGETGVVIENADLEKSAKDSAAQDADKKDNRAWYIKVLDFVFGYKAPVDGKAS